MHNQLKDGGILSQAALHRALGIDVQRLGDMMYLF